MKSDLIPDTNLVADKYLKLILKEDVHTLLHFAFRLIDDRRPLIDADYLEYLCNVLMEVAAGQTKRLIVNLPPRHLKSILISVVFPVFLLLRNSKLRIAVISHSQSLARDLGLRCLRLVTHQAFQERFPEFELVQDRCTAMHFETTSGGARMAFSIDSGITGFGADVIITDDPQAANAAQSHAERTKVNETYDTMIASRLDDPLNGCMIIAQQRLHEGDLTGYLLAKPNAPWTHIALPLVAEEDADYQIGAKVWHRKAGEALIPDLFTPEEIERLRAERGASIFATQYQQNPAAAEGELIKPEHLNYFSTIPSGQYQTVFSCDTAVKTDANACYSAILVIRTNGREHYVIDVLRAKLDPKQLSDAVIDLVLRYGPEKTLIEDASGGPGLASRLSEKGFSSKLIHPGQLGKVQRLEKQLHVFAQGRVFIKADQHWTSEFRNELLRFPYAKYDDQVDALTQFLNWNLERPTTPPSIYGISTAEQAATRFFRVRPTPKGQHPMRPRDGSWKPPRRF